MTPNMWLSQAQLSAPPHLLLQPMTKLRHLTLTAVVGGSSSASEAPYYGARRADANSFEEDEGTEEDEDTSDEGEEEDEDQDLDEWGPMSEAVPPSPSIATPPDRPYEQPLGTDRGVGGGDCSAADAESCHSPVTHLVVKLYDSPRLASVETLASWMPMLTSVCLHRWQTHPVVDGNARLLHALVESRRMEVLSCVGCPGVTPVVCREVERGAGRLGLRVECWPVWPGGGSCLVQELDNTDP